MKLQKICGQIMINSFKKGDFFRSIYNGATYEVVDVGKNTIHYKPFAYKGHVPFSTMIYNQNHIYKVENPNQ